MSATPDKNEMDLNLMSKEELMKYLMKNMEKKEVNNIIKECNKKVKEKKYIINECVDLDEDVEDRRYRITEKEAYVKYIMKDKEKLENLLTYAFNEYDFNNFTLEELEIKNDTKIRKPDNPDENPDGIRCDAMVWGGGKGGRCKSKCVSNGLCKLHYEGIINKKRLLAYGHYYITGEYSVPDLDGKNLRRDTDNELEYKSINDVLLLKPLNAELFNIHKKHYKKSLLYTDDMKCVNDYMNVLEITDKEKKRLYNYYDPNLSEHKNPINEIMNVEPEEEEEETDYEPEEEEEIKPNDIHNDNEYLELTEKWKNGYLKEMSDLKRNHSKKDGELNKKGLNLKEKIIKKYEPVRLEMIKIKKKYNYKPN